MLKFNGNKNLDKSEIKIDVYFNKGKPYFNITVNPKSKLKFNLDIDNRVDIVNENYFNVAIKRKNNHDNLQLWSSEDQTDLFTLLPYEILLKIFLHIPPKNLWILFTTCKLFYEISRDEHFWKKKIYNDFIYGPFIKLRNKTNCTMFRNWIKSIIILCPFTCEISPRNINDKQIMYLLKYWLDYIDSSDYNYKCPNKIKYLILCLRTKIISPSYKSSLTQEVYQSLDITQQNYAKKIHSSHPERNLLTNINLADIPKVNFHVTKKRSIYM